MEIRGSCLCGEVVFEVAAASGPFELCHCGRCRKSSGSAFASTVRVDADAYRIIGGAELVTEFRLPIRDAPPAYAVFFCRICGSPVPDPAPDGDSVEVPAGLFDGPLVVRPERHIYVEHRASWSTRLDELPRYTGPEVRRLRTVSTT